MRLLVVEDSMRLRTSLEHGLTRAGFSVDSAADGPTGLSLARSNPFDLIVLDLMLPGMSGLEVLGELREGGTDSHVLILTALGATHEIVEGFERGADDYLTKPFALDELIARIRAQLRRRFGRTEPVLRVGDLELDPSARTLRVAGVPLEVTARDFKLLEVLIVRSGEVVSREELEDHVYRTADLPASNAIDTGIYAVRRKLEAAGARDVRIRTVRGMGYVLESGAP